LALYTGTKVFVVHMLETTHSNHPNSLLPYFVRLRLNELMAKELKNGEIDVI
jgi:hypothetical protein